MGRDPEIEAILAQSRRTRRPIPRWQWLAAAVVALVCGAGFAAMMLAEPARSGERAAWSGEPAAPSSAAAAASPSHERRPGSTGGFGFGMVIGAGLGIVIGVSIARQRRDHSSRNSP